MKQNIILLHVIILFLLACSKEKEENHSSSRTITVTFHVYNYATGKPVPGVRISVGEFTVSPRVIGGIIPWGGWGSVYKGTTDANGTLVFTTKDSVTNPSFQGHPSYFDLFGYGPKFKKNGNDYSFHLVERDSIQVSTVSDKDYYQATYKPILLVRGKMEDNIWHKVTPEPWERVEYDLASRPKEFSVTTCKGLVNTFYVVIYNGQQQSWDTLTTVISTPSNNTLSKLTLKY